MADAFGRRVLVVGTAVAGSSCARAATRTRPPPGPREAPRDAVHRVVAARPRATLEDAGVEVRRGEAGYGRAEQVPHTTVLHILACDSFERVCSSEARLS